MCRIAVCVTMLMLSTGPVWADCLSDILQLETAIADPLITASITPEALEAAQALLASATGNCIDDDPLADKVSPGLANLAEAKRLLGIN